jgi:dipeptidyl aminopeptidase/acylaminoacyl peptidase
MAPADILRIPAVSDPQISPDGEHVAYTVSSTEGNDTRTTIWVARPYWRTQASTSIDAPYRLLPADWSGSNPRWSPDGKRIAFLSTRDDQNAIWVVTLSERGRGLAGAPRFVAPVSETNFFITYAGESFAWSPDGTLIAFISTAEDDATGLPPGSRGDDPRVIDRIQYKSRTSLADHLRTHVWFTTVDNPEPRQLTKGPFYDHALSFSPRGDEIAFISNHELDPDANNNSDIFAVDLHGQTRQITQTRGCEYEPAWSPDGRSIAYIATTRDVTTIDSVAEDTHVWVISAAGGDGRELAVGMDRRARSPRWTDNGRAVLFLAGDHGRTFIYKVAVDDGKLSSIFDAPDPRMMGCPPTDMLPFATASFQVGGFTVSAPPETGKDAVVAFTVSTASRPTEVYVHPAKASCAPNRLAQVSETGAPFVGLPVRAGAERQRPPDAPRPTERGGAFGRAVYSEPEEINFKSDGMPIQGWLMRSTDWRPDRKYPMILSIHGGPHGMYGYAFNPTFHVYASRGYAVLYLNPRGSSGYGQKFSDGTLNEWGGGDYRDLMAGVDEALKKYPWIDQERLGVMGGSYGGFMTNWIITQTPRFKAAVSSASVSNLISFYSTSLYQDLIHAEFGGFPWDNYDQLWQWSPLRYARLVQTPTLFLHGEQDNDVPISQAEEMYMALRRRGVETVLVRYPREGHGFHEPRHRVDALERTLAWFDRFLK